MADLLKLVPSFSYPVSLWSERVDLIIQRSVHVLTDATTNTKAASAVFAKLPLEVARLVPAATIAYEDLILFLRGVDQDTLSLAQVLAAPYSAEERPSIFFAHLCDRLSKALPKGTTDDHVRLVAWDRLRQVLPQEISSGLLWCKKDKPPSDDTLRLIDEEVLRHKPEPKHVLAVSAAGSATEHALIAAVTELGKTVADMRNQLQDLKRPAFAAPRESGRTCFTCGKPGHISTNCQQREQRRNTTTHNQVKCYNCGGAGHMAKQCPSHRKPRDTHAVENPDFCFYHNAYGERARKCEPPCTFRATAPPLNG